MKSLREASKQELIVLMMTVGIIFPFYISGPLFIISALSLIVINRINIFSYFKEQSEWMLFFGFTIVIALYYSNLVGVLVSVVFIIFYVFFKIYRQIVTESLYQLILKVLNLLGGIISVHAIIDYIGYILDKQLPWNYILIEPNPQFRVEATLFNANYFGLYIILSMVLSTHLLFKKQSLKIRALTMMILMVETIALILTASRMVFPSLIMGLFVLFWFYYRKGAMMVIFFAILLSIMIWNNPSLLPRFESIAYGFEDRFQIWQHGWQLFLTNPLTGRGAQSYMRYYYLFTDDAKMHAHQLVIEFLANFGLIGLMLLVNAMTSYLRNMVILMRKSNRREGASLILAFIAVVMCHGLMDVSIVWLQTGYLFLIVVSTPIEKFEI